MIVLSHQQVQRKTSLAPPTFLVTNTLAACLSCKSCSILLAFGKFLKSLVPQEKCRASSRHYPTQVLWRTGGLWWVLCWSGMHGWSNQRFDVAMWSSQCVYATSHLMRLLNFPGCDVHTCWDPKQSPMPWRCLILSRPEGTTGSS